jgi:MFS family permease
MRFPRPDFSATRETLQIRNFAVFTAGNGVSLLGTWVQRLAVGWLTWKLTESGAWLGAVALAEFAPVVVLAPLFGVMNDRFDRRRIAIIGQYFAAAQAAALAVLTLIGAITPLMILLLQLAAGIVQPLIQTARLVLVPAMVPRERVGNAVAITSLMFNAARIVGPMIAGLLITHVGVGWAFALNATSYIGVIVALYALQLPPHQYVHRGSLLAGLAAEATAGWKYVFTHPTLGWVIPVVGVSSALTWPIGDLLPGIADHVFQRGAQGLAVLTSAQGIGAILGGLFLAQRPTAEGLTRIVIGAMTANGLLVAAFALTPIFWLAVPIILVSSFFSVMVGVGSQSLTQTIVTEQMRGRALSVWYTITRAGPASGALLLGSLSTAFGFKGPLFVAGAITAATAAIALYRKRPGPPA